MIHWRRTIQIAPRRQADAIASAHEQSDPVKVISGAGQRVWVVISGTLGRLCISHAFESMAALEASVAKVDADPRWIAMRSRIHQQQREGVAVFVPNTHHDEFWRDA